MPTFIAAAIAAAFPTTAVAVIGTITAAEIIAAGIVLGGTVALSSAQASRAKRKQKEAYNAAQVDRMANVVTTVSMRDLVLGRVRKGGSVAFRGSAGALKDTFLAHLTLAGHEIDAVEAVYLNDQEVTLDANGYVQTAPYRQSRKVSFSEGTFNPTAGTVVALAHMPIPATVAAYTVPANDESSQPVNISLAGSNVTILEDVIGSVTIHYMYTEFSYYARIRWDLGGGAAVADARTKALFPDLWTDDHRGQGVAKLIAEFTYNETAFPSGIPAITARVRGAKVYDPRTGITAWSDNPALLARHVYQHPQFGKATVSAAEDARFIAAANACDTVHGYVVAAITFPKKLYRAGLVAPYGTTAASLLDDLCQAMAGMWAFAGGELYIRAGVYTAPVMSLTDADLAVVQRRGDSETQEQISIAPHRERAEKFNVVNLRIWDEQQDHKQVALTPVKAATLITRDGQELAQEAQLAAVSYAPQAQHVAGVMMRDARDPLTLEAPFKMRAYPLELFDTIELTLARYSWVAKTFVVLGRVWEHDQARIKLTLKETSAAIYTPDAEFLPQGYAENTSLPRPWNIEPPVLTEEGIFSGSDELVALADGTILTRVRVTWAALTDQTVVANGQIELQWQPVGATAWQSVLVDASSSEAYIVGASDGAAILVRARARNAVAVSDWSDQVPHVVIGKTENPPPVDRFKLIEQPGGIKQFFWTIDDVPADLQSFLVRYSLGTLQRPWDEMITLFAKGKNAREHETTDPKLDDTYTFAIRTVDSTGNMSEIVYITEVLDGDAFGSVARIVLPHELSWPGTKTDCFVSGTLLVDEGLETWADYDIPWYSLDSWAGTSISPIVYEHPVVDMGAIGTFTVRANSLAAGTSTIEYSASDDDVTYSAWASVPNSPVTGRYFKLRWTVDGVVPILYRAQIIFYV